MPQERNGGLTKWAVGVFLTALVAAAGWAIVGLKDTAEAAHALAWEASTEARVIRAEKNDLERRLTRIEGKLDLVLERVK